MSWKTNVGYNSAIGDFVGPASAVDGLPVAFDGTTGKLGKALTAAQHRTNLGLGTMSVEAATSYQPIDGDLTAIAALSTTGTLERTATSTMRTNNADRSMQMLCVDLATNVATANNIGEFVIPPEFDGYNIVGAYSDVETAGTTNLDTIQMDNTTKSYTSIFSTALTIDSAETSSRTAATPAVVDTAKDDVSAGDRIKIHRTVTQTTPAKGSLITLLLRKP